MVAGSVDVDRGVLRVQGRNFRWSVATLARSKGSASDVLEQISKANPERARDPDERRNCRVRAAVLDVLDVLRGELGSFGELLLG